MSNDETTGAPWMALGNRGEDKHKPKTMEGYYWWFMANSNSGQKRILKYALARLAREYPDTDPREVLLEFFAESIYAYEQHAENMKRGQTDVERQYRKELAAAEERLLAERTDKLRRAYKRDAEGTAEQEAQKREGSFRAPSTSHRRIPLSLKLGG